MSIKSEKPHLRKVEIVVQTDTRVIEIRLLDWRRIFREVESIPIKKTFYMPIACVFFGVGATALLSLAPLHWAAQNVNPWVIPSYLIIGIAAILLGLITWNYSRETDKMKESSCLLVQQDMKEINSLFFPNDNLDADKISKDIKSLN